MAARFKGREVWVTLGLAVLLIGVASGLARRAVAAPTTQFNTITVVTKPIAPFVFTDTAEPRGFSIDLWDAVAREAGLDYRYEVVDTVAETLQAVQTGEAQVAIAAITITEERERLVDFSVPYYRSGLGILTRLDDQPGFIDSALAAVTPSLLRLLLALLGIIIIAGHVIWLIERRRNPLQFPQDYLHGVWEGIWWAAVTLTTVGYGDKTPLGIPGRIFGLFWMLAGLFIIANFTAGVTASLTAERLTASITGPGDLPGRTVATVAGSTSDDWLTGQGIFHRTTELIEESYALLEDGEVEAVVYDFPVLQYHVLNSDNANLIMAGGLFNTELYGIALEQDSIYRERVDQALLRVIENGTYGDIHQRWFGADGGL
jgi:ABC-type amino acid transport substrate-binding protein